MLELIKQPWHWAVAGTLIGLIVPTLLLIGNKKFHSIFVVAILPKKPIRELKTIMTKEVATALFMGNFAVNSKAGIIKKPPPTPTKPVKIPIKIPLMIKLL